jgi:hypothetical protein
MSYKVARVPAGFHPFQRPVLRLPDVLPAPRTFYQLGAERLIEPSAARLGWGRCLLLAQRLPTGSCPLWLVRAYR